MSGAAASNTPPRVVMKIAGQSFSKFTRVSIKRSLKEISGSFSSEYVDEGRLAETLNDLISPPPFFRAVKPGMPMVLMLDSEPVLTGWTEVVEGKQDEDKITSEVTGRDICGDLVECAALPNGPAEFKKIDFAHFCTIICAPFKIGVLTQTVIGAAFPVLSVSPHDKALAAMEKVARQRAVLITSDGNANLLLTTAGSTRAPASIIEGENATALNFKFDHTKRFSDVYVKGQTARANGNHTGSAVMTPSTEPTGETEGPAASTTASERAGIVMTGHANDPEITRYRPDVRMVRTQSGASTVQAQAEWHIRVDRGLSATASYSVVDWRAGESNALWRPNQLVAVYDPFAGIDDDMLISEVEYIWDEHGSHTVIHVVGKTAFDRVNEAARKQPRHKAISPPLITS